ncbi:DUF6882 domain-containing protein [Streptomyces sp. NPDC059175]|uniref:DUF6882 domain-containing protein n=1 Tax=Streptomyces sp. NPDC059175 TaxID=3346757 RepID=UPI0036A88E85
MFSEPFQHLTARHAAWGAEQLETFNEFLLSGDWTADLARCTYRQAGRELRISLLGTFDTNERSWLWSWANPGLQGTPVVAAAEQVRQYGQTHGLAEFADAFLDLSGHDDPRRAAETLAFTAMGVLGAPGYLGVQANPDARAYLVPDDPQVPWAEPNAITLPRVLLTGVQLLGGPRGGWSKATSPTTTSRCGGRRTGSAPGCPTAARSTSCSTNSTVSPRWTSTRESPPRPDARPTPVPGRTATLHSTTAACRERFSLQLTRHPGSAAPTTAAPRSGPALPMIKWRERPGGRILAGRGDPPEGAPWRRPLGPATLGPHRGVPCAAHGTDPSEPGVRRGRNPAPKQPSAAR